MSIRMWCPCVKERVPLLSSTVIVTGLEERHRLLLEGFAQRVRLLFGLKGGRLLSVLGFLTLWGISAPSGLLCRRLLLAPTEGIRTADGLL